ncbi:MAG: serine/threonine-protein kinase [Phycisphaerae bacterium]
MTTDESQQTHELFDQAVELPPERRAAFLAQRCPDPRLRAQVDRLLAADSAAAAQAFLRPPPADSGGALAPLLAAAARELAKNDPLIGRRIGRFHIKSLCGVGGMARVYEAVQEQPHRVVALKVMNSPVAARSALRRFQYESQVLGRLRHPNIAQIYEAGVADVASTATQFSDMEHRRARLKDEGQMPRPSDGGQQDHARCSSVAGSQSEAHRRDADAPLATFVSIPYFAMEYLPGARPITQFVVEKGLDTRRRVELFIKICDAVHHGHQRGVIHRDLKPANLLVEAGGEPKVIDFGVARGTDSDIALTTQQTHLGELVGTMQYMSPEQCDGDPHEIDTRSDVYSLGMVLYELLTGGVPYDVAGSSIYQATQIIKERFPARPSTVGGIRRGVARRLRADLDTIVLKALEKDRERRYASAAALADDLRRSLTGEPIAARRPTFWSRVTRRIYRRPAATMLIASAFGSVLIVAGGVVGGWYWGWYWGRQAATVEIVNRGRELRINARNGGLLYWSGHGRELERTFIFARILEPWRPTNPRRPLLVGVRNQVPGFQRGLNVFDADALQNLSSPQHVLRVDTDYLPPILRQRTDHRFGADSFGVSAAMVADVFEDVPGQEIVVAFQHGACTQTMIAVFDLDWRQRYCVWVDAQISDLYWMPSGRELVLLGCNGLYFMNERDLRFQTALNHPLVVFAITPELDFRRAEYVAQEESDRASSDARLHPRWYWMLPDNLGLSDVALRAPVDRNPEQYVEVEVASVATAAGTPVSASWILDEAGNRHDHSIFADGYKLGHSGARPEPNGIEIPGEDQWKLQELPPPRPEFAGRPPGSAAPSK